VVERQAAQTLKGVTEPVETHRISYIDDARHGFSSVYIPRVEGSFDSEICPKEMANAEFDVNLFVIDIT
jgi:hypothetical protein